MHVIIDRFGNSDTPNILFNFRPGLMETTSAAKEEQSYSYEDFVPLCNLQKHEEYDILEVHLPGFKRQEVKLQFNELGLLTISGEQSGDGDGDESSTTTSVRSRFYKELKVSRNCRADQIRAKFSRGILSITVPKKVVKLSKESAEDSEQSAHTFFGFGYTIWRPKLSKENALKMVGVSLATVLAGYAVYRLCTI